MNIRHAVRAGTFYEAAATSCEHHAQRLIDSAIIQKELPSRLLGGIVPHAGWMYSGRLAAMTFNALASAGRLDRVVLLGADHYGTALQGEVFDSGVWRTPLGEAPIDEELARALLESCPGLQSNPDAHTHEHSLEVQVPLLQVLNPLVRIVPITVPPLELAPQLGTAIGQLLAEKFPNACVVGSTDLTHHGGHFPAPGGRGQEGAHWSQLNDRRMIDLIVAMRADAIVPEADEHQNACGAGAIAATVAACAALGAAKGHLLEYTNSYDIVHSLAPGETDDTTVGYASIVFA